MSLPPSSSSLTSSSISGSVASGSGGGEVTKQSSLYGVGAREVAARLAQEIRENQTAVNERSGGGDSRNVASKTSAYSSSSAAADAAATSTPYILVHRRQRGNPVLKHIRAVKWNYHPEIHADYIVGGSVGVVFLSVKYHLLHPDYIRRRLAEVRGHYCLAILLLYVDEDRPDQTLEELTCIAVSENVTIVCCWSSAEAARYLETFKLYEKKSATVIQGKEDESYSAQLSEFLTTIRSVTRRDVLTLISNFGSLAAIMQADMASLALCPGLGPRKCQNIWECFHGPLGGSSSARIPKPNKEGAGTTELKLPEKKVNSQVTTTVSAVVGASSEAMLIDVGEDNNNLMAPDRTM